MIKNDQSSSAVYGLFYDVPYEAPALLGIYFLEGEAEAARAAYIAKEVEDGEDEEWMTDSTRVVCLQVGLPGNLNFVS
jgi:hypothetical protein